MNNLSYGVAPRDLGWVDFPVDEMMFYLYLPIKMRDHATLIDSSRIPKRLWPILKVLQMIPPEEYKDRYVYLTCKHTHVNPHYMANRPGWHCDGFGTDDINYIWHSCAPTEFCIQPFRLSQSDKQSLADMETQARDANIRTYPDKHLLRLTERVVHRVTTQPYEGLRTFFKISISRHRFNLVGNSRNHLIDYDWKLYSRDELRNMENNGDSYEG
jgi:hypothetical protein